MLNFISAHTNQTIKRGLKKTKLETEKVHRATALPSKRDGVIKA